MLGDTSDEKISDGVASRIKSMRYNLYGESEGVIIKENPYYSQLYEDTFRRSIQEPEEFWSEIGKLISWSKPWDKALDNTNQPFTKWFVGGELNACYNAVDRHVEAGKGSKVALIHDSPLTKTVRKITYAELLDQVSHLAGGLAALGIEKGDRVLIYMPLIPEAIMAMLATARLGAVHSVVFGGFAARELCTRIEHCEPKVIIAASCGIEPHRIIRYKDILNEAIEWASYKPEKCIIYQRRNLETAPLDVEMDISWDNVLKMAGPHKCVPVEANEPLYILYTSGTTDAPKGVQRPIGGHIVTLNWSMQTIYGMGPNDVWWSASDLGWVVGHSYICYGPLLYGITSVMYEGKPDRTPDPGQYFRIIDKHKVNAIFTVPTSFRVIKREDPDVEYGKGYSLKSLKRIFVAGEHCDYDTKSWVEKIFNVPVLNHWWQTETGHAITATCVGLGHSLSPPKYTAGMPFPGYDVRVLKDDGTEAKPHELARIVVKLPLPPGTMSTLYQSPERFCQLYFRKFPGYYDTMDAGYIDEFGYIYVTARDDDVINVAGHRLSTSAMEDIVLSHPDIVDATVVGVPEPTKGEIPLCLFVTKKNAKKSEEIISKDLIQMVRDLIGPIASFRLAVMIRGLPRTRSGKTCRKSISDLARNKTVKVCITFFLNASVLVFEAFQISGTVEDPTVYKDIKITLQRLGYARTAPDPQ
ncbi:PREDICTED: acyl-CoA synthetase short-chain family member 3, mitochondrial isoform X2 [Nicrophorus vespilloides]|uniref:Acyl-CoA synthetase short-chain family member 3, mitochondrial n=1 Tax=Nicrophorus vespilloides TaxID=110193 RepID=A0ABM1N4E7_NICVS|nr:PREDICTED: acyl-CoA synthetase short-chain family member 3, mitochondrial isoform X2 [Nicrophorus vespilloides]